MSDPSRVWLPELVERIASVMPQNDVACTLRLVNKATAAQFHGRREFATVRLSQPVPHHAFAQKWAASGAMRPLTLQQRHRLLCLTAASGSMPNMKVALEHVGFIPSSLQQGEVLAAAAGAGRLQMCERLLRRGYTVSRAALNAAARSGQRAICELYLAHAACSADMVCAAARGGHPDLMEWLLQRLAQEGPGPASGSPGSDPVSCLDDGECEMLLAYAAEGCDLQTLQSLCLRCPGALPAAGNRQHMLPTEVGMLQAAAGSPSPDWRAKVEWLESLAPPDHKQDPCVCGSAAAASDAICRLTWLQQRGYALSSQRHCPAIGTAAQAGNVAVVEHLIAQGANPLHIGSAVAQHGLMQRLSEQSRDRLQNAPRDVQTAVIALKDAAKAVYEAARTGNFLLLQWAVQKMGASVPSGDQGVNAAYVDSVARMGNVEMLAWMHERGYLLGPKTFTAAARGGCEAALEWLAERGCPLGSDGDVYMCAACNHDLATLHCLQRLGCPWGPAGQVFTACVWDGCPLPVLLWLAEAGCPVDWEAAVRAASQPGSRCPPDVRAWVAEQREQQKESRRCERQERAARQPAAAPPRMPPSQLEAPRTRARAQAEQQAPGRQEREEGRKAKRGQAY